MKKIDFQLLQFRELQSQHKTSFNKQKNRWCKTPMFSTGNLALDIEVRLQSPETHYSHRGVSPFYVSFSGWWFWWVTCSWSMLTIINTLKQVYDTVSISGCKHHPPLFNNTNIILTHHATSHSEAGISNWRLNIFSPDLHSLTYKTQYLPTSQPAFPAGRCGWLPEYCGSTIKRILG